MILVLSFVAAFLSFLLFHRPVMKFLSNVGITSFDMQKPGRPRIPTSAGLMVIIGILGGLFFFIGVNTFVLNIDLNLAYVMAGINAILIITMIGFFDDIYMNPTLTTDKGLPSNRRGLMQSHKALLTVLAAVPLMAVKAGTTVMILPFLGPVNFGIVYPLVFIPVAVACVANATNMLAGMNGLEAGLGLVSLLSLGIYSMLFEQTEAAVFALVAAGALLALLYFNWSPARILPGDSLTYLIGAVIVTVVVLGNMEKFGLIIFIPWMIEAFLKLRSGFRARSLGDLQPDGTLAAPYKQTYSLTHIVMKAGRFREHQVSIILIGFEAIICVIAFALTLGKII